jgi:integrase
VRSGNLGRCTWNGFRSIVDSSLVPEFGTKLLTGLTFEEVEAWHSRLLRRLKPVTAKNHMLALKQIEDFAIKRKLASKNVAHEVLKEVGYARKGTIRTFQMEDVQRLVGLAENLNVVVQRNTSNRRGYLLLKAAVQLAAFCGLRMGEIFGLTVESIDLKAGVLKVRHSLTQLDELKGPKTAAGNRDVPIPMRVQETLQAWLQAYYVPNPRRLVFRMSCGKMVTPSNFRTRYWVPLLKRAGLHDDPTDAMHFHALRHFAASLMIDLGLPLTDVASLMGHEKFDMTLQVYAHPIVGGNRRRDAFERISAAITAGTVGDDNATFPPKSLVDKGRPIATG